MIKHIDVDIDAEPHVLSKCNVRHLQFLLHTHSFDFCVSHSDRMPILRCVIFTAYFAVGVVGTASWGKVL